MYMKGKTYIFLLFRQKIVRLDWLISPFATLRYDDITPQNNPFPVKMIVSISLLPEGKVITSKESYLVRSVSVQMYDIIT